MRRHSKDYNFFGDTETGITMRWADSFNSNPVYAPWPELADISISNHCSKGCEFCYKDSEENQEFMLVEQYEYVLSALHDEKWGDVFQVALGGGEPLEHPNFLEIINKTNERGIVANFTTNGMFLDKTIVKKLKDKVGAVAISISKTEDLYPDKIRILAESDIRTNIHFVLDNQSIEDAIELLKGKHNELLKGVNGVVFLTYKPKGRASLNKCLSMDNNLKEFTSLIESNNCIARIGFDACFVPILMKETDVNVDYVDSCECGFFSVYIDEKMNVKPCSFANNDDYSFNLKEYAMDIIWREKYEAYRNEIVKNTCKSKCKNKSNCRGKCIYYNNISLCFQ